MDYPDLTVSTFKENSIGLKRVKYLGWTITVGERGVVQTISQIASKSC